jgi:hypothetical protein
MELSQQCDIQIKLHIENKTKNIPPMRGQNSSIVTTVYVNIINDNNNNRDNRSSNPSYFVTSTSSNIATDTSNNVVPSTTQSFVPSDIELSIPPHYYSPSVPFEETFGTPPHSSSFDDDDDAMQMYNNLISGGQAV